MGFIDSAVPKGANEELKEARSQSAEFLRVSLCIWLGFLHKPQGSLHNIEIKYTPVPWTGFLNGITN